MGAWFKNQSGQAVVEAALLIPLLLFILVGILVVGQWLYVRQVAMAASREGARVGAQTGDFATLSAAARAVFAAVEARAEYVGVTATAEPSPRRGSALIVEVRYTIPFIFNYFRAAYAHAGRPYPFQEVVAQSVSRLEVDYAPE